LFPQLADEGSSLLRTITKQQGTEQHSNQGVFIGAAARPFDFRGASELKRHNVHHSRCIEAKKVATVGLGHENEKVSDTLDPLCRLSWLHTALQISEDFEQTGNGLLEVVRDDSGKIAGLHFLPVGDVRLIVENDSYNYHYEVHSDGTRRAAEIKFAAFGDLDDFRRRHTNTVDQKRVSEIVHFVQPTSFSKWWGQPDWLAAIASIELVQAITQHQFDFHINRGVPEFMLFIMGSKVRKGDWTLIEDSLKAQIGLKNSHKSMAVNLVDPNIKVQLERLATESGSDGEYFASMMDTLSVNIVSAHGTPPAIAGIVLPGKMGAANEASNALMSFQAQVIGHRQKNWETTLDVTLGGKDGVDGLSKGDFKLNTIIDEMSEAMKKLQPMDTMGRMRSELPEAAAEGRDLEDGVKKADWDIHVVKHVLTKLFKMANRDG
jgi:capsid portal protein